MFGPVMWTARRLAACRLFIVDTGIDIHVHIHVHMHVDKCAGMCADLGVDMCADVHIDTCIDMCIEVCIDRCIDMRTRLQARDVDGIAAGGHRGVDSWRMEHLTLDG